MTDTIDPSTPGGARTLERLGSELIDWLTTVNPDGQPQSSPIWFLWDGEELLIYSHKRAPRNGNVAERPLVSFNLNTNDRGGDVATIEGSARVDLEADPPDRNAAYLAKYGSMLASYEWTPAYFAAECPVPIRVRPTRWRVG